MTSSGDESNGEAKTDEELVEKDCPLEPFEWIMFLSGEINTVNMLRGAEQSKTFTFRVALSSAGIAAVTVFSMNLIFAGLSSVGNSEWLVFFAIIIPLAVSFYITSSKDTKLSIRYNQDIDSISNLRSEILIGNLTDSNEILGKWESIRKTIH